MHLRYMKKISILDKTLLKQSKLSHFIIRKTYLFTYETTYAKDNIDSS